ncbi:MAG: 23S rRNA (adenine(2503)-C(2))-methyltransferase RlmN [Desulfobulbaceae bacterium]|nr:MAG: 23S rRNA (adenine(2503)-C(2))-methyltransferase RlmN [Desulfobulbaceae bacterium]
MTDSPIDCKDFDTEGLVQFAESLGQSAFRGKQIMSWLYKPGIVSFDQMTDLAKSFRELLHKHATISFFSEPIIEQSQDGSIKFGFVLADSNIIESVLIPEEDRLTLCISSQVGCSMGCSFCGTAYLGFTRNLSPSEIVNQVVAVRDYLISNHLIDKVQKSEITNLVFMGMGEPLNNFDNLITAINILTDQKGLDIASRRITVSTCGIVHHMKKLGERTSINLAISLHAVDNQTRNLLMPINKKYPIEVLIEACKNYPMKKRKRIMIEYVMLDGVNDSLEEAHELARLLQAVPCKINLLTYNPTENLPYQGSSREKMIGFQNVLRQKHYSVFIRSSRGSDIAAACGQLAGKLRGGSYARQ